uniref:Small ribosomal subunit protein uS11c n=1 Tax=Euglena mutabilis TaxID=38275 RepID=A0A1B0UL08_EUGMU|nr:ribosomal protein S11 [Euglena mutabilis]
MLKQNKTIKNVKRKTSSGIIHIKATFNNTLVSVTDLRGNVISWSSSGSTGFKGSRKSTPFASQTATNMAVKKAMDMGIRQVEINISGPGSGRETAIRAIQALGLSISIIRDVTPIPHNGCRPTKKRRI